MAFEDPDEIVAVSKTAPFRDLRYGKIWVAQENPGSFQTQIPQILQRRFTAEILKQATQKTRAYPCFPRSFLNGELLRKMILHKMQSALESGMQILRPVFQLIKALKQRTEQSRCTCQISKFHHSPQFKKGTANPSEPGNINPAPPLGKKSGGGLKHTEQVPLSGFVDLIVPDSRRNL